MGRRGQELSPERQDRAIREMYGGFNDHSPLPDLVGQLERRQVEAIRGQQQSTVLGTQQHRVLRVQLVMAWSGQQG